MKSKALEPVGLRFAENVKKRGYVSKTARFVWRLVLYVVVFGLCFVILQPLIMKISTSLMTPDDIFDVTVAYVPKSLSVTFYKLCFEQMQYPASLAHSFIMSSLVALLQVASSSLVAYGFARYEFPGRNFLFGMVIFTMLVPPIVTLLPQYLNMSRFDVFGIIGLFKPGGVNLLKTMWPYVLTSTTVMGYKNGLYVYLMRQHYKGLPRELEEAATIDGCSSFGGFLRIVLPTARTMMVTCGLFAFVWQWTDGFYYSFYQPNLTPLSARLTSVVTLVSGQILREQGYSADFLPPLGYEVAIGNTAVLMTIAPLLLLFLFAQRWFMESIDRTGLK